MIWGRSVQAKASVRTKAWGGGRVVPSAEGHRECRENGGL